jgi:hypothetical protein
MAIGSCPTCSYPLKATHTGEILACPYCSAKLEATVAEGVTIPTPVIVGVIAFALGVVLGPSVLASTEAGSKWLEKKARERIK